MKFYCGIDLSARDCHVCVIDEQLKIVVQQKLRNELVKICQLLGPYKANLKIVVESTFNWYWLVDGLQAEGFDVVLTHTLGLYLITDAKVKTDRRDAYALAKLLLVGVVPAAYIYPVETRLLAVRRCVFRSRQPQWRKPCSPSSGNLLLRLANRPTVCLAPHRFEGGRTRRFCRERQASDPRYSDRSRQDLSETAVQYWRVSPLALGSVLPHPQIDAGRSCRGWY